MQLTVDFQWCSKCKMCRAASGGRMRFAGDGYPIAGQIAVEDLKQIQSAVERCPIGALALSER